MKDTLRHHLLNTLPDILPPASQSIKGTRLISLLNQCEGFPIHSEKTLRYYFAILSQDPSSPIAKVEKGQGYYLRPESERMTPKDELARLRAAEREAATLVAAVETWKDAPNFDNGAAIVSQSELLNQHLAQPTQDDERN